MQIFRDEFNSFADFLEKAQTGRRHWNDGDRHGSHDQSGGGFYGTQTWADAVTLATEGWPEGREQIVKGLDAAARYQQAALKARGWDVAGAYPDVPRFCSGAPDSMVDPGDQSIAARPIIRILYSRNGDCSVSTEQITNRGCALLSHIDALEDRGYSVELNVCLSNKSEQQTHIVTFPVKRAGEPLEPDRMAFVLAHAALFRRFGFCLMEQHPEMKNWQLGYGGPCAMPPEEIEPGQIYIPTMNSRDKQWQSIESAVEYLRPILTDAIAAEEKIYGYDDEEAA